MALRWLEGFEGLRHETLLARLYESSTGSVATVVGPRNNNAIQSRDWKGTTPDLLAGAADENTWVVGLAFRVAVSGGLQDAQATIPYVSLRSAAGEQLRFEFLSANSSPAKPGGFYYRIRVMRGATVLAQSNEIFDATNSDLAYTYFELKATVRTGVNGSFSAKFHTRKVKNQTMTWSAANTGINTANQGADGADRVELSLNTGADLDDLAIDDAYVVDSTGAANNDFLGELYIEALDPQSDGATVQWTLAGGAASLEDAWNEGANVQSVAEDDKRVTSKTVGQIELAVMSDLLAVRTVPVVGVQTRITGKMEASGTRNIQFFYRKTTGAPAQVGGRIVTFPDTVQRAYADTRETDPNTGLAWVVADIDGVQLGVELDA